MDNNSTRTICFVFFTSMNFKNFPKPKRFKDKYEIRENWRLMDYDKINGSSLTSNYNCVMSANVATNYATPKIVHRISWPSEDIHNSSRNNYYYSKSVSIKESWDRIKVVTRKTFRDRWYGSRVSMSSLHEIEFRHINTESYHCQYKWTLSNQMRAKWVFFNCVGFFFTKLLKIRYTSDTWFTISQCICICNAYAELIHSCTYLEV